MPQRGGHFEIFLKRQIKFDAAINVFYAQRASRGREHASAATRIESSLIRRQLDLHVDGFTQVCAQGNLKSPGRFWW
jgi:hypothetical protein